ncbi:unnamed protein product [Cyprideis torosa]|uniref:Uncharacterized protein n=1 Tax=Cyprideis torosa TaxID=163714 RepID=A0A7R8W726_9CRUS|nr:unnamed protein product [Cyprideis torosa]CAG0887162.1 unnamed protein product [Cyprideis torosa]
MADDQSFQVEKILDKRTREIGSKSVVEYLIKWANFPNADNSWEPELNLQGCDEIIAEFEKTHQTTSCTPGSNASGMGPTRARAEREPRGFARGLEPEIVLGSTKVDGQLKLLIKWKGTETADLVPNTEANVKCPELVIKYYEQHIRWS